MLLPQSLSRQPSESRELLSQVSKVVEMPQNDGLALGDASRICNREIISKVCVGCFVFWRGVARARLLERECSLPHNTHTPHPFTPTHPHTPPHTHTPTQVQQVICFAFHDSRLLLETCAESKDAKKIVTLFYLD